MLMAKKKRKAVGDRDKRPGVDASIDFEQALSDVESIVGKLESGELGLTDSLQQYEIGIKRLKQCHALLQQAERRVTLLSGVNEEGNPITEAFDVEQNRGVSSASKNSGKKGPPHGGGPDTQDSVDDLPGLF